LIVAFDLDDTLYDERSYVDSGFLAVADFAHRKWGLNLTGSQVRLQSIVQKHGRGRVFDIWLDEHRLYSKANVWECVQIYRRHKPDIRLYPGVQELLAGLSDRPLYLITDGNKDVQARKIDALGIQPLFQRVFITHRFGIQHAKPSVYCFELIKAKHQCGWGDIVYVGDNPAKDFVGLNRVGARTVRVHTGVYKDREARDDYDAQTHIPKVTHLTEVLKMEET